MLKIVPMFAALAIGSTAVLAQTTTPAPTAPSASPPPAPSASPAPAVKPAPSTEMKAPNVSPTAATTGSAPTLTDAQAKSWINKKVYSSDNKNMGEVAEFARDSAGKVTELHADIGGFLGIGETRVKVLPSQFKLEADRVVLNLNAEQVKALPAMPK